MSLASLSIQAFRNIERADIEFSPSVNLFAGENGSGKTSLLESIYYLSSAKSFRTSKTEHLVQFGHSEFILFAQIESEQGVLPLGISRTAGAKQNNTIRLAGTNVDRVSKLASILPIQVVTPESYKLFFDGPSERRKFVDLGVFHVEHVFHATWLGYSRLLKQRNALLKQRVEDYRLYHAWDEQLAVAAASLDQLRETYINRLETILHQYLEQLLPNFEIALSFNKGWRAESTESLALCLQRNFSRDLKYGYTQFGSHKFDLKIRVDGKPAELVLSRGQLKLLLFALKIAQSELIGNGQDRRSIFVVDDLPSELDEESREKLADVFKNGSFQLMISGIEEKNLDTFASKNFKMFHVKHGTIY